MLIDLLIIVGWSILLYVIGYNYGWEAGRRGK